MKNDLKPNMNIEAGFQAPDGSMINLSVTLSTESDSDDAEQALLDIALNPLTWAHVWKTFRHAAENAEPNERTMFEMDANGNHHKVPSTIQ